MLEEQTNTIKYVGTCPRCGNDDFSPGGQFCKRCGLRRFNSCLSDDCSAAAPPDAAYCEMCGHVTYYHELGAVAAWQPEPEFSYEDDLPF